MNQLNAIGGVGRDAEIRYTPDGKAIANFSFALTSGYGDKQITTWINCSMFGKRAETLAPMITKGVRIGVTGELVNRPWVDKNGNEKFSLELRVSDVTLLGKKEAQSDKNNDAKINQSPLSSVPYVGIDDMEENIPF